MLMASPGVAADEVSADEESSTDRLIPRTPRKVRTVQPKQTNGTGAASADTAGTVPASAAAGSTPAASARAPRTRTSCAAVVVDGGRAGDDAAGAGVQPGGGHADQLLAPAHRRAADLAGREQHDVGYGAELVDVVAEPRPVDELEAGEQRVLRGVPAVRGDVQDVDPAGELGDGGRGGVVAREHRAPSARPSRRPRTSSSARTTRGPATKPADAGAQRRRPTGQPRGRRTGRP